MLWMMWGTGSTNTMSDLAEEATESGSVSSGSSSSRYVPTYFILITKNSENTSGMKLNKYVAFCGVVTYRCQGTRL